MAEDIIQKVEIQGADQAVADLNKIADAGEQAFNRLQAAGDKTSGLGKGIDEAAATAPQSLGRIEKAAEDLGTSIGRTAVSLGDFTVKLTKFTGVTAGAAAGAMLALAKAASNVTSSIKESAIAAGTSAENFAKLSFAASQSGANAQKLQRAFAVLSTGGDATAKALEKFGVQLKNTNGTARDSTEVLLEFADKIAAIDDPAQKSAAAAEVFGRRLGPGLTELLSEGSKGIKALGSEAKDLGLVFSEAELKVGKQFGDSLDKLASTAQALATRLGLAFSPAFIALFDSLSASIAKVSPLIVSVADAIGSKLTPAVKAVTEFLGPFGLAAVAVAGSLGGLVLGFQALAVILGPFAGIAKLALLPFTTGFSVIVSGVKLLANSFGILTGAVRLFGLTSTLAFGPIGIAITALVAALAFLGVTLLKDVDWTAFGQAALAVIQSIITFFQNAATAISDAWTSVKQFFTDLWASISQGASDAWAAVVQIVTDAWTAITGVFTDAVQFFVDIWTSIKDGAQTAWDFVKSSAQQAFTSVLNFIQPVIDGITRIIDVAKAAAQAIFGIGAGASAAGGGGGGGGFAGGGYVSGPGTRTSDSILARLSNGEFVVRAAAVDKYGVGLLHALNGMRLPLRALRGFASGGLVDTMRSAFAGPQFAFASGGLVSPGGGGGGRPINLTIDGQTFGMVSRDNDTAERLVRYAVSRSTRSAGKKPTYFGGG